MVIASVGEGYFGTVAKCVNLNTSETTAIKERKGKPFSLNEIRPVAQQLLVAFEALRGIGIIHTDLKSDNIMLVDHQDQPFKVKLIDFGLAMPASETTLGMLMQPVPFRAPEVNLGLPISAAVDMWGLGCVLGEMYFQNWLFPGGSTYNTIKGLCHLVGQPGDHLLNNAMYTRKYFNRVQGKNGPTWRLKTQEEYSAATGEIPDPSDKFFEPYKNLKRAAGQAGL
ncbi:hypothetical protein F7725_009743 [Dissostichus mawsoni]|uniref:Protein kinase domain-containing protein n=1 Tax=Dissostichus mawsoni TaxID=36200 RepID=A0A7J5XLK9_DISMA|nr:hypothetical protein F7725_009743 [Dissostichus mawsoni]